LAEILHYLALDGRNFWHGGVKIASGEPTPDPQSLGEFAQNQPVFSLISAQFHYATQNIKIYNIVRRVLALFQQSK
jgi:hypothetical protein